MAYSHTIDYDSPDSKPLCEAIEAALQSKTFETFRVTNKRADKRF